MIPIYLISLEQDIKRREELQQRFPKNYNNFILIKAIDGRKLSAKDYYDKTITYFIEKKQIMSPAELGCTFSHIKALKEFLKTDAKFGLIIEDDILGNDDDLVKISIISQQLDENSLFICGGQEGLLSRKYQYGKKTNIENVYELIKFSYKHIQRTCCYVITDKSAKTILKHQENHLTLADKSDEIFSTADPKMKIYYSSILSQPLDLKNSHIEQDRAKFKNKTILQKIISPNFPLKLWKKFCNELMAYYYSLMRFKKL